MVHISWAAPLQQMTSGCFFFIFHSAHTTNLQRVILHFPGYRTVRRSIADFACACNSCKTWNPKENENRKHRYTSAFPASLGFLILQIPLNSETTLKPLHFHGYTSARTVNRCQNISTHLSQELSWWGISYQPHNPKTRHRNWHTISRKWALEITWSNCFSHKVIFHFSKLRQSECVYYI